MMEDNDEKVHASQEKEVIEQSNQEVITNDEDIGNPKGEQGETSQQTGTTVGGTEHTGNDSMQSNRAKNNGKEENTNLVKIEHEGNEDPIRDRTTARREKSTVDDGKENDRKGKANGVEGARETKNNGEARNDQRGKSKDDSLRGVQHKERTQVSGTTGNTDRSTKAERKDAKAKSNEIGSLNGGGGHDNKIEQKTGENVKKAKTSQMKRKDKKNETPKNRNNQITNDSADASEQPIKAQQKTRHREGKVYGQKKVNMVMATAISDRLHRMSIGNSKLRKEEEKTRPSKKLSPEEIEGIVERLNQAKKDYTEPNKTGDSSRSKMLSQDEIEALTERLAKNKPGAPQLEPQRNTLIEGKHFEGLNADEKREKIEDLVRRLNEIKNPRTPPDNRRNITEGYRSQGIFASYIAQQ